MDRTNCGYGIVLAALVAAATLSAVANAVDFAPSIDSARTAGDPERPVVVTFSAPWCGWCRKMASTTFPDPLVADIADRFLWVKLDPDEATSLAARLKVHGLPHTVVLNAQDQLLGSQPGYMTPGALVQFLEESLANPRPLDVVPEPLLKQLADLESAADPSGAVREAVELLAGEERNQRAAILDALHRAGPGVYPHLAQLLVDERLSVRAAAGNLLMRLTQAELPFDPFAAADLRTKQATAWISRFPVPDAKNRKL